MATADNKSVKKLKLPIKIFNSFNNILCYIIDMGSNLIVPKFSIEIVK